MHRNKIAYDNYSGTMHSDCIAYDKQDFKFVMINIVRQCIGIRLLMISIVVHCMRN